MEEEFHSMVTHVDSITDRSMESNDDKSNETTGKLQYFKNDWKLNMETQTVVVLEKLRNDIIWKRNISKSLKLKKSKNNFNRTTEPESKETIYFKEKELRIVLQRLSTNCSDLMQKKQFNSQSKFLGLPLVQKNTCTTFGTNFNSESSSSVHSQTQIEENLYCSRCKKTCSDTMNLKDHMKLHTNARQHKFKTFNKTRLQRPNLKRYFKAHTVRKPYKCIVCLKSHFDFYDLRRQIRTHTGEKPYKCPFSTKCFSEPFDLKEHIRTRTREKPYSCATCNKSFAHKGSLKMHSRIHTGEKPYKCQYCAKCFSESGTLNLHIRTHTGEKPYSCETCKKSFTQNGSLKEHLRTPTGEKPYKCITCCKPFTHNNSLLWHSKVHTKKK